MTPELRRLLDDVTTTLARAGGQLRAVHDVFATQETLDMAKDCDALRQRIYDAKMDGTFDAAPSMGGVE